MAENLWTLALFLALIFHGGMDTDGTLGTQEGDYFDFTSGTTNLIARPHSPLRVSWNAFLAVTPQEPHFYRPHYNLLLGFDLFTKMTHDPFTHSISELLQRILKDTNQQSR